MYNKKNDQLFIYGPRCDTNEHFFIWGGGAWQCLGNDFNNRIESRGTKMPTNADLILLETYVQQGKLINRFSYMSHNVTKCTFLAFWGGRGPEHVMSKVY